MAGTPARRRRSDEEDDDEARDRGAGGARDDAPASLGAARVDVSAGERHLGGERRADDPWEKYKDDVAAREARLERREPRAARAEPHVGRERQRKPAADRVACDRRDDRLRAAVHRAHEPAPAPL